MIILLFLFLLTASVRADQDVGLCCLCNDCNQAVSGRGNINMTPKGDTCDMLSLLMADPTNGSSMGSSDCRSMQNKYRKSCCDSSYTPIPVVKAQEQPQAVNM
jgi:hypothetical protein